MFVSHAVTVWCNKGLYWDALLFLLSHYTYGKHRYCNICEIAQFDLIRAHSS